MSDTTLAERIRARAYALWQQDGSLEGCADEYWRQARALVEQEITVPDALKTGDAEAPAPDSTQSVLHSITPLQGMP